MKIILLVILLAIGYAVLFIGTAYFIVKKVFQSMHEDRDVDFYIPQQ